MQAARGNSTPGPYGERNTHVRGLLVSPRGLEDLTAWANFWLTPGLSPQFRQPWLHCGAIALDKGGGKPRPIVLQEALLKLVTGGVAQAAAPQIRAAAGSWQRGVYHSGGAPQLVWELCRAVAAEPGAVLAGSDCRNAFGCAYRAPALTVADAECPMFGRLLRNLWTDVDTVVHVPAGDGEFDDLHVQDGFVQGGCEAAPGFAFCLAAGMRRFLVAAQQIAASGSMRIWAYADN